MLWMYQRVFLGRVTNPLNEEMTDLGAREKLILVPVLAMMLWMGVYSGPFLRRMDKSIDLVAQRIQSVRGPDGGSRVQHAAPKMGDSR